MLDPTRAASLPSADERASPWRDLAVCLLLAVVVYLPAALGASFLNFDDNFFFGPDNPEFREGLGAVLDPSRRIANAWLPVAHLSLWFDWWIAGGSPLRPHLHALLLHGLAGFALVRLLRAIGASGLVAAAAGALFVVHPALAESVAWVSGRKDVLSGLFTLLALLAVVRHAARPRPAMLAAAALCAALAMYSKATAVVLPLLAALVVAATRGQRGRWWGVVVVALVVAPIAWHHQIIAAAEGTLADGSLGERLHQVPGVFSHYVATAVWPTQLNVLYPEVATLERFRAEPLPGSVAIAVLLVAAAIAWRRAAWRLAGVGLLGFGIALLPFNTAFPASSIAAADRYLYLALPFLALAFALPFARLPGAWRYAVGVPVVVLAWLAGGRAHDFADSDTLWRSSLRADPDNAVAHLNLVQAWSGRPTPADELQRHLELAAKVARIPEHGRRAHEVLMHLAASAADYPRAAQHARSAIAAAEAQLARERSDQRGARATALLLGAQLAAFDPLSLAGDEVGANGCHDAAKALAPDHPDVVAFGVLRDLAACRDELVALAKAGKLPLLAADDPRVLAAERTLAAALATHADHAGLLCARAEWARASGQVLPALRWYNAAAAADPQCVQAWLGAARLLRERETWSAAEEKARAGLRVRPDPALRQELALALIGQGRLDDAEQHLEAYMRVYPQDAATAKVLSNVLVGRAYAKLSASPPDGAEARRLVDKALAYNPAEAKAHLVLGRLASDERRLATAVDHLERAFRQMPDYDEARQLYTDALARFGFDRLLRADDDGMADAFRRCLDVAPEGYDTVEMGRQLQRVWKKREAEGLEKLAAGDRAAAAAAFRRCLQLDPAQHWAAWLLAMALHDTPGADLAEIERLCRQAIAWQERHRLEKSRQVLLLATTLQRAGRVDAARALAADYLAQPEPDAKPQALQALQRLANG